MTIQYDKTDRVIVLELQLELGESYMHGKARLENESYPVNIQGGASQLVVPVVLYNKLQSKEVIANFRTESGKSIRVELPLKVGKDILEIYDDSLMLGTGWKGDMPVFVELSSVF